MQDRVSATPGRMLITPENGQPAFYATVELADNPSVEGTPLNKASLLTDETAALFGLGTDAVPNDVFRSLATRKLVNSFIFSKITDIKFKEEDYGKTFVVSPDFSDVPEAKTFTVEPSVTNNSSGAVSQSGVTGFCIKSDGSISSQTSVRSLATVGAEIRVHVLKNFDTNLPYIIVEGLDKGVNYNRNITNTISFASITSTPTETANTIRIFGEIGMKVNFYEEIYGGPQ